MPVRSIERQQFLADIIITALEGGIGYWATALRYKWSKTDGTALEPGGVHAIIMEDDDEHQAMLEIVTTNFVSNEGRNPSAWDLFHYGATIDPEDEDSEPLFYKLDIDTIAVGVKACLEEDFSLRSDIREYIRLADKENDAGDIDADGADAIVQAALFGKLVYG